jgi:trimeric autotransporter adhesin
MAMIRSNESLLDLLEHEDDDDVDIYDADVCYGDETNEHSKFNNSSSRNALEYVNVVVPPRTSSRRASCRTSLALGSIWSDPNATSSSCAQHHFSSRRSSLTNSFEGDFGDSNYYASTESFYHSFGKSLSNSHDILYQHFDDDEQSSSECQDFDSELNSSMQKLGSASVSSITKKMCCELSYESNERSRTPEPTKISKTRTKSTRRGYNKYLPNNLDYLGSNHSTPMPAPMPPKQQQIGSTVKGSSHSDDCIRASRRINPTNHPNKKSAAIRDSAKEFAMSYSSADSIATASITSSIDSHSETKTLADTSDRTATRNSSTPLPSSKACSTPKRTRSSQSDKRWNSSVGGGASSSSSSSSMCSPIRRAKYYHHSRSDQNINPHTMTTNTPPCITRNNSATMQKLSEYDDTSSISTSMTLSVSEQKYDNMFVSVHMEDPVRKDQTKKSTTTSAIRKLNAIAKVSPTRNQADHYNYDHAPKLPSRYSSPVRRSSLVNS